MADEKPKPIEPKATIVAPGTLYALAVDEKRGRVFVGGSEGRVFELSLNAAELQFAGRWVEGSYVAALVSRDVQAHRHELIVARYDGSLTWYDLERRAVIRRVAAHRGWIRDLQPLGDGRRVASVGHDQLLKVWDAESGDLIHSFAGHPEETPEGYLSAVYTVTATPDGNILASGDRAGEVRLWDVAAKKEAGQWRAKEFYTFDPEKRDRSFGGIRRLKFSPDGRFLAIAGIGAVTNVDGFVGPNRLEVWDWRKSTRVAVLQDPHNAVLNDLLWTSTGRQLLAAGGGDGGGVIVVWQLNDDGTLAAPPAVPSEKPAAATTTAPAAKPASAAQVPRKVKFKGHAHRLQFLQNETQLLTAGFEGVQWWHNVAEWWK